MLEYFKTYKTSGVNIRELKDYVTSDGIVPWISLLDDLSFDGGLQLSVNNAVYYISVRHYKPRSDGDVAKFCYITLRLLLDLLYDEINGDLNNVSTASEQMALNILSKSYQYNALVIRGDVKNKKIKVRRRVNGKAMPASVFDVHEQSKRDKLVDRVVLTNKKYGCPELVETDTLLCEPITLYTVSNNVCTLMQALPDTDVYVQIAGHAYLVNNYNGCELHRFAVIALACELGSRFYEEMDIAEQKWLDNVWGDYKFECENFERVNFNGDFGLAAKELL